VPDCEHLESRQKVACCRNSHWQKSLQRLFGFPPPTVYVIRMPSFTDRPPVYLEGDTTVDIARRFRGGLTVLDLTGRFVVSPGEGEIQPLRSAIRALIAEARVNIALNLAGLTSIDARGLGELVFTRTVLRGHGGDLALVEPSETVRKLLHVTRLERVFRVYGSEVDAVRGSPVLERESSAYVLGLP
jgi:anti-sigma B factor antagonist